MRNHFKHLLIALPAIAVLAVTGCASSGSGSGGSSAATAAADQGDISSLEAAAKQEGSVVWYTEEPPGLADQTVAAFKNQFGIDVQYVALNSGPLTQRYEAEGDSGSIGADVVSLSASTDFMNKMVSKGYAMNLSDAKLPVFQLGTYPTAYQQPNASGNGFVSATGSIGAFEIIYKTDVITGDMIPKSVEDLADPKYKGLLTLPDPASSSTIMAFFVTMQKAYGDDWYAKLVANEPKFFNTVSAAGQAMVAGEGGITTPALPSVESVLKSSGAPVDLVMPPVTSGPAFNVMLTATDKSPHPNAGKLFANWMLSKSGAAAANGTIGISPYDPNIPSGYTPATTPTAAESAKILQLLGRPAS